MQALDRAILRLALPSIVSNITVPLLGLCDVTVMGHVGGATSIAAIAVGSMAFNVMYWLFVFLRMSTGGLTAQAFGGGRWGDVRHQLRRSLSLALAFGGAIVALQVPLRRLVFWLLQTPPDVSLLTTPYFHVCIWGAPAVLGLYAATGWLVGMQDTRSPMAVAIAQNIVNIGLSLVLVLGFGMGILGVAIGTLTAQWAGLAMAVAMIVRKLRSLPVGTVADDAAPRPRQERRRGGTPDLDIFLRTVCLVSVNLYFTSAGAAQGALTLAANTLLMQFFTIYSYMTDGFAAAGEALAGRHYGAGDMPQLSATVRRLFRWGLGVALLFTVVYAVCGPWLLTLLTSDGGVVAQAMRFLPWAVAIPFAGMAAFVWDGIFIGTTRTRGMLAACATAAVCFFSVWALLSPAWGNHALWLSLVVFLACRGAVQTLVFLRSRS